ncbi:MAG: diaminopimelate epimerase [Pseudomonadota bacterium]
MELSFTKMHALGNDFVVLDFTESSVEITADLATRIADRHSGIGCDQILIVEKSDRAEIDFGYRIINADGSEVGQCGNGARCFAKYVCDKGLSNKGQIRVSTISGDMSLALDESGEMVTVDMGVPKFDPAEIPLLLPQSPLYSLELDEELIEFSSLSMGNPHAVMFVEDVCHAPVELLGPTLEHHAVFPERANVGFAQINSRDHIGLRVHERGVGETLACGSGACAAVVAGIQRGLLEDTVTVTVTRGDLTIHWPGSDQSVKMTGPATTVFDGSISI